MLLEGLNHIDLLVLAVDGEQPILDKPRDVLVLDQVELVVLIPQLCKLLSLRLQLPLNLVVLLELGLHLPGLPLFQLLEGFELCLGPSPLGVR